MEDNTNLEDLENNYKSNNCDNNIYSSKCNEIMMTLEKEESKELEKYTNITKYSKNKEFNIYPNLNDKNFNFIISSKKEFNDNFYDGTIQDIKEYSDKISKSDFELSNHQIFVKNFLSFQTPYNSLLLYHGLGSGKTCSAIGICEEYRDYLKQLGINKRIIIVASPNVQDNFRLQLFDERKLSLVEGLWNIKSCTGNKFLKEINPTSMKGLTKEKIISQINTLINTYYLFIGYTEFANYVEKIEGLRGKNKNEKINEETKNKNIIKEFDNRLIVIDEVHNIRNTNDNKHKRVAEKLTKILLMTKNVKLVLLSATPMYNSQREIVWLLNLMNINDKRAIINTNDIFDKNGDLKIDENGNEIGKEILIRKSTGYISFVRGENPYTFPNRIYPNLFDPNNTFMNLSNEYPKYTMNGKKINKNDNIKYLNLYLTNIGSYQSLGYQLIVNNLSKLNNFKNMNTFGYTILQNPLEALNIVYPIDEIKNIRKKIDDVQDNSSSEEKTKKQIKKLKNEKINKNKVSSKELKGDDEDDEYEEHDKNEEDHENLENGENEEVDEYDDIKNVELGSKEKEIQDDDMISFVSSIKDDISSINSSINTLGGKKTNETKKTTNKIEEQNYLNDENKSYSNDTNNSSISILSSLEETNEKKDILVNTYGLIGKNGLKNTMNYHDSYNPPFKGDFEYKQTTLDKYSRIFSKNEIGKYSSKIKKICDCISTNNYVSKGIILIYSQYIDSGLIPMALALEEMGITRYGENKSLFKNPPVEPVDYRTMLNIKMNTEKDFKPAKYTMITGDFRLSPNNYLEIKNATDIKNKDGSNIKIILISKSGSEGIDLKFIRQIHILEPWYNMNRIEQIIGRGVRNLSHKDLPFEERNVEIYLHGTLLEKKEEESVDLYIYRIAELKAIQIGKVSRILKENSVDCMINHEQTNFTQENFEKFIETPVKQILSSGIVLDDYKIGDQPHSSICDYMENCYYNCNQSKNITKIDDSTYNERYILNNIDKIIYKIKMLMKDNFFYKKNDLIKRINIPKQYKLVQIYAALSQLINDKTEYITDKYGRIGYLENIGEYYLFQPSELNDINISIFERSVPINFKHEKINFDVKENLVDKILFKGLNKEEYEEDYEEDKRENITNQINETITKKTYDDKEIEKRDNENKKLISEIRDNYDLVIKYLEEKEQVKRGDDDYIKHTAFILKILMDEGYNENILKELLLFNFLDVLNYKKKLILLNYIMKMNSKDYLENKIKEYFEYKFLVNDKLMGIILYNDKKERLLYIWDNKNKIFILGNKEDERDLNFEINKKYKINEKDYNNIIGFLDIDDKTNTIVFKVKDTTNKRNKGSYCHQAGKMKNIQLLNKIFGNEKFTKENTKNLIGIDLCIYQNFILRYFQKTNNLGKIWFFDYEKSNIYNF